MNFFRRLSIRTKMTIIMMVVGLPVVLTVAYHLYAMNRADHRKAGRSALVAARSIAYQYTARAEGIRNLLTALSRLPQIGNGNGKEWSAVFRDVLRQSPSCVNIGIADSNGKLIASALPTYRNISKMKFFRDAIRSNGFNAGEYALSKVTGKPALHFALPVKDSAGKPEFILYAAFDFNQFNGIFDAQKLPPGSVLYITDNYGAILYRYPSPDNAKPGLAEGPGQNPQYSGAQEERVYKDHGRGGNTRILAFKGISLNAGAPPYLNICLSVPEGPILEATYRSIAEWAFIFMLAAVFTVALNHFLVGRIIVRPIQRLVAVAQSVTNGNYSVKTGQQAAGAEMGLLAKSFDAMTSALENRLRERMRTEALLKENEEKLHEIFDHMNDAIFIHEIETGAILEVNETMCAMFGYGYQEIFQLSVDDLSKGEPPYTQEEALSRLRLAAEGKPQIFEWLSRHKDGHLFWTEVSLRRATIGGADSVIALVRDISERKDAEERIKAQEAQLRALIENSPFHLWALGLDGRYFMQNAVSRECWGDYLGKTPDETAVAKDIVAKWHANNQRAFAGEVVKGEVEYTVNGRIRNFYNIIAPIKSDHAVIGIMGVNIDITDRKVLEAQLYQAQKMEAVGQLAGGIAHDFNNILTAIIGYSHLLAHKITEGDPLKGYVSQITNCADRAAELTQGLLDFSRKQIMNPQVADLNEIVERQQKMLRMLVSENIDLQLGLHRDELPVLVDNGKMEQVLMNLVMNAKDATPEGGTIRIDTASIDMNGKFLHEHGYGTPGRYACIAVRDSGCGMDQETRKKIFEPFFTTKEVGRGTGLGLSIVYGIVKQHNGYVNVYSEPGRGSIFKIYLPLVRAAAETNPVADCRNPRFTGSETVLIAEDDPAVREFHRALLEEAGYRVICAEDGREALEKFVQNEKSIALLILDVIMPKMNGKQVLDSIRNTNRDVKALFVSGYPMDVLTDQRIMQDECLFLMKPVVPDKFLETVRQILCS